MGRNKTIKNFVSGFIIGLAVMLVLIALVVPGVMWLIGNWPAWTLLSYFITIPSVSGCFSAWISD